jgi:colanic acid biosynthesis glycosyl transferase WcaI
MRLLFINAYYPPDATNSAYILGELTEDLARSHEIEVIAGRPSYNPVTTDFSPQGVRIVRVPSTAFSRRRSLGRAINYVTFTVLATGRACVTHRPDAIVTMSDPPIIGVVGALAALRFRCLFIQLCHDVFPDIAIALGKLRNRTGIALWRRLNHFVRSRASALVVVGRDMRERLIAEGVEPSKIVFIPTWANRQEVDSAAVEDTRQALGWHKRFVVMHAGNIGLPQNLGALIQAAELLRDHSDILIAFLGDGAAKADLVQQARQLRLSNVVFMPYVKKDEAQTLMAAAHVHIVSLAPGLWGCATPSKTYGIMAAGRPFIAAVDAGSEPARIVEEFECGTVVPSGEAAPLAEAILNMRSKPLDEMGRRAQAAFRKRYQRGAATDATRRFLEQLLAHA